MSKYNFKQLHDLLTRWGQANRSLPANNDALKQKALDVLQPGEDNWAEVVTPRRRLGFWRISFASLAGVYATYLIISPYAFNFFNSRNYYADPYYAYPQATGGAGDNLTVTDLGVGYAESTGLGASQPSALQKFAERIDFTNSTPITDTREFMKTGYHASVRTRQVEKLQRQIQTMIRGYGGRIDNASASPQSGSISFVLPKSALDSFENELGDLVPEKFLTTNISSYNLLPQKQSVEKQTDRTQTELADYEDKRDALIADHNNKIASFNKQMATLDAEIKSWSQEVTTDTVRQAQIDKALASYNSSKSYLATNIANENKYYQKNLNYYDSSISSMKSQLSNLADRDQAILNDVETVQGSVSLRFVSVVEIVNLYVPVRWLAVGVLVVFMFIILRGRRQNDFVLP